MVFLVSKVKQSVSDNLCYKDSIRNAAINCDFKSCDKLLKNVNDLFMNLQKSNDPDTFYSSFTSLISSKTETIFTTLVHSTATLMAINLARQKHQELLKENEQSTHTQKAVRLTKNEINTAFQYLCGYVVKNLIKKKLRIIKIIKLSNQTMIAILEGISCALMIMMNWLSKGGLTAVHNECLLISLMAEEIFRKNSLRNPYKIDVAVMVDHLTAKPEVISISNNVIKESGVKFFGIIENYFIDINFITLPKSQSFSKAKDIKQNN